MSKVYILRNEKGEMIDGSTNAKIALEDLKKAGVGCSLDVEGVKQAEIIKTDERANSGVIGQRIEYMNKLTVSNEFARDLKAEGVDISPDAIEQSKEQKAINEQVASIVDALDLDGEKDITADKSASNNSVDWRQSLATAKETTKQEPNKMRSALFAASLAKSLDMGSKEKQSSDFKIALRGLTANRGIEANEAQQQHAPKAKGMEAGV